ncbi:unnamed protein product [Spirodela intermedia]|uniref:Uncharacterized protein n=1 Tax=Spirodela intermedia TaxID=51605 RepID=A0A7I8JC68_SPIIN|nr:unnamed protein product [Spirodela intermedia]CAA6667093.1 unnamed protein product [Spirodela intermedia]
MRAFFLSFSFLFSTFLPLFFSPHLSILLFLLNINKIINHFIYKLN